MALQIQEFVSHPIELGAATKVSVFALLLKPEHAFAHGMQMITRAATTRCKSFLVTLTSLKIEKRAPLRDSVYRVYPYWVIFARTEGQKLEIASVSHFITDKKKLILRVKRIRGQIDGIERAIASDCVKIVQAIASIRGALTGLMGEVLECHVAEHVVDPRSKLSAGQLKGTKELLTMIKIYVR